MADDPLTVALRVEIALAALAGSELVETFVELAGQDALHASVLAQAASRFSAALARRDAAALDALRAGLGLSPDDRLRRLALSSAGRPRAQTGGWTDDRIAELQSWREDPLDMVAKAAQFTFVATWRRRQRYSYFAPIAAKSLLPTRPRSAGFGRRRPPA